MIDYIKSKFRFIGIFLMILSLGYIGYIIVHFKFVDIDFHKYSLILIISTLIIFSMISGFTLLINSLIWKFILEYLSQKKTNTREIVSVYIKSNISKYLPGNVMQYAARIFLGKKFGWSQKQILYSSLLELILSTLATFLILIAFILINRKADFHLLSSYFNYNYLYILSIICVMVIIGFLIWGIKSKKLFVIFSNNNLIDIQRLLLMCFSLYLFIYGIASIFWIGIFYFYTDIPLSVSNIIAIIEASIIAYFAGFIAIGSPAGIGVREAITIFLLSPICNPTSILIALTFMRLCEIIGDLLAYFIIIWAGGKKEKFDN